MNKYANLFEYFRQCPFLSDLLSIAAESEAGNKVILPQGASQRRQYRESFDAVGAYQCDIIPYPSLFEDFQINCYLPYDVRDKKRPQENTNVLNYNEVSSVCEWVREQDNKGVFPDIGLDVFAVECYPFVPQVRYVDANTNTVCYYITVRVRYVNPDKETKSIYVM